MIQRPHLLITDDDRAFRETLRELFEPRGFRTSLAADGAQAIKIVKQSEIHVVLMDLDMPRLPGLEAMGRIKSLRSELPCILISGKIDEEVTAAAEEIPVFSCLNKPVSATQVRQTVCDALTLVYGWQPNN